MTASRILVETAEEAALQAVQLAYACDLANTLNDTHAVAGYVGQIKGINIVLDIIADKLKEDRD